MDIASINMPSVTLNIQISKPRGFRIRMALLHAALWLAGKVSPPNIDVRSEIKPAD